MVDKVHVVVVYPETGSKIAYLLVYGSKKQAEKGLDNQKHWGRKATLFTAPVIRIPRK